MVWRKEASGLNILSGIRKGKKAAVAGSGKGWKITSVRTFLAGMKNCCRLGGRRLQRTKSNSVTLQFRKFGNKFYTKCNLLALQGASGFQWLPVATSGFHILDFHSFHATLPHQPKLQITTIWSIQLRATIKQTAQLKLLENVVWVSQVPRPSCVEGRENEGHIACE